MELGHKHDRRMTVGILRAFNRNDTHLSGNVRIANRQNSCHKTVETIVVTAADDVHAFLHHVLEYRQFVRREHDIQSVVLQKMWEPSSRA